MTSDLERVRRSLAEAEDTAPATVQEQLNSIGEGLDELVDGDKTEPEPGPKADRLEQLEEKLMGLESETDDATRARIEDAREHLRDYRLDQTE